MNDGRVLLRGAANNATSDGGGRGRGEAENGKNVHNCAALEGLQPSRTNHERVRWSIVSSFSICSSEIDLLAVHIPSRQSS